MVRDWSYLVPADSSNNTAAIAKKPMKPMNTGA
jgi:hypothetical protein